MTEGIARGLRLNNPFNLKEPPDDKVHWVGERATDDDPIFEEFDDAVDGIRAGYVTILNYNRLYGLWTVDAIIYRFAPPKKAGFDDGNPTAIYSANVARQIGIGRNVPMDFASDDQLLNMGKGIVHQEQGCQPFDDATLLLGLSRARAHLRGER